MNNLLGDNAPDLAKGKEKLLQTSAMGQKVWWSMDTDHDRAPKSQNVLIFTSFWTLTAINMDRNVLNFDLFVLNCCFFSADYHHVQFSIVEKKNWGLVIVYYGDYIMAQWKYSVYTLYKWGILHYTRLRCIAYLTVWM